MNIKKLTYHKGNSRGREERVEVEYITEYDSDWFHVNVRNLCGGFNQYKTEHGLMVKLPIETQLEILRLAKQEREKIRAHYPIKTYAGWSESGIDNFDDYCKPGDEVDAEMADYFLNVVPPSGHGAYTFQNHRVYLIQCGEPYDDVRDENGHYRSTFITFERRDGKWFYSGMCYAGETVNRSPSPRRIGRIDSAINALEAQI